MSIIVAPTTDKAQAPTSEDSRTRLFIVDHAQGQDAPGTYMTAYKRTGVDWTMTVDYFEDHGQWAVYALLGDDTGPLTREVMCDFLAAHEDAQGVADHFNAHPLTVTLNAARGVRTQTQALNGLEVTI